MPAGAKYTDRLMAWGKRSGLRPGPEWRNWQTQETQNLPPVTRRVGSTPSSGTIRLACAPPSASRRLAHGGLARVECPERANNHASRRVDLRRFAPRSSRATLLGPRPAPTFALCSSGPSAFTQAIAESVGTERYLVGSRTSLDECQAGVWLQPRRSAEFLNNLGDRRTLSA
jgi:hypothetical protein